MIPACSTGFSAHRPESADSPAGESVRPFATACSFAGCPSPGGGGISLEFLARHTTDRSLVGDSCFSQDLGVSSVHTAYVVDPVLSIPAERRTAPAHLQWRCVSEQSVGASSSRINPVATPGWGACSRYPSLDDASPGGATRFKTGAVGGAEITSGADSQVHSSSDSHRLHDVSLGEIVSRFKEFSIAVEQKLLQRLIEEQQRLQSAPDQSSGGQPTGSVSSEFGSAEASLIDLQFSLQEASEKVARICTLIGRLSREQKRPEQAQSQRAPQQEQAEPPATESNVSTLCRHYQRLCDLLFPCCGDYYPCHRCHNDSDKCSNAESRALNATHLKCHKCNTEQEINEGSKFCSNCATQFSEYFCAKCKHFTSADRDPFHCDKCGICRVLKGRSFHCDVCNVCLDKRLEGKHKCRPDSGHDECCICLEDAFSGCQVLPCSHKVHKDCAIAMVQNGVRACPVCRHPI